MLGKSRSSRPAGAALAMVLAGALAAMGLSAAAVAAVPQRATGHSPLAGASTSGFLSEREAAARAKETGKAVVASALTTQTSQTTALPSGALQLTQSAVPSRVFQHGAWKDLDARLKANPDGTLSPLVTPNTVVLSGGGTGPLLSQYTGGQGFSLTLGVSLPHPTVSGPRAVYRNVIAGVDLTVTVKSSGAVGDVFTVRTRAAARNPQLAGLLKAAATTTRGLQVTTDQSGGLTVADPKGRRLYTAPTPYAWDSSSTAISPVLAHSIAAPATASTADAPGHGARKAVLPATAHAGAVNLAAPSTLLDDAKTVYPVYLDPTYSPTYGKTGWSSPGSGVANQNFWDDTVDYGVGDSDAEVGNSGDVQGEAMSLFNLPIPVSTLRGAKIYGAYFGITETDSWACPTSGHDQTVNLYAPSQTLSSSNATWNNWVGNLGSVVDAHSFAMGYNSSCPAGGAPAFSVGGTVTSDISAGKTTQTLALRADDHTDNYAFKEFDPGSAKLTITYDKYPNTPSGLKTSPVTNCAGSTLGDTGMSLYATASTPTKAGLTTTFHLYKTADTAKTNLLTTANGIASDTWSGASGQAAVMTLPESFFARQANGAATSFSFIAQTTDGTLTSGWSSACTYTWDPTRPGAPGVTPNPSPTGDAKTCATRDSTTGTIQPVGTTCSFTLSRPTTNGTTTAISGYRYQINQAPPVSVQTTGDPTINVPLQHLVNTLTVSALSAGGNIGTSTSVWFDGAPLSPPAADGDLTLDGTPDLIVPGSTAGAFPPGLWLATGNSNGMVTSNATNIGVSGLGFNPGATPSDWNGAQAITGNFCGNGAQDVMAYFPTGANAGGSTVVCNDGASAPLHLGSLDGSSAPDQISSDSIKDDNGNTASQVVTAGNTSGKATGLPDLLAVTGDQLTLFFATAVGSYGNQFTCNGSTCFSLTALNSPDGAQDWSAWTITTAQLPSGTAMYLWNPTTGALDLWTGLALDSTGTTLTTTGQYAIATNWNTAPTHTLLLRAADIAGAGTPGLWATDTTTGSTTAYLPANIGNNPSLTTASGTLTTAKHAWNFQDIGADTPSGTALTTTSDSIGTLGLTGTTGAVWNTGDLFTPDAQLNTKADGSTPSGGTGRMYTASQALDLSNSFTLSAWVFPNAYGGTVLSQDGATNSGITLTPTTGGWQFALNTGTGATWTPDTITGGTAQLETWAHLTATYDKTIGVMNLYVDDVFVATGTHTAPATPAAGAFQIGDDLQSKTYGHYFSGQIADIAAWTSVLPPAQPHGAASYHQALTPTRILDTRTSSTVHGGTTTALPIAGITVTPSTTSAPTKIPNSVTAVAVDVTVTDQNSAGFVTTYPDGIQRPITSSTNYAANTTVTGYQIVPVGTDGKIDLYTHGTSIDTVDLVVDVTGYFTSDATLTGNQTYTPLATATRALDTRTSVANTNLTAVGTVPADKAFTLKIAGGIGPVPSNATAVAVNLTTANATGNGYLEAYATGAAPTADTSLTYDTSSALSSMAADTPIATTGTGAGTITIYNHGSATAVIVDIAGYYTNDTSGQTYHPVNPTRLVDTRNGTGGSKAASIASYGTYTLSSATARQITPATNPTLSVMLTITNTGTAGNAIAYPDGSPQPSTSNINFSAGDTIANLALVPTGTTGQIDVYNHSGDTADLLIDCSGYFGD